MKNPAAGFIKRLTTSSEDASDEKKQPLKPHQWRGVGRSPERHMRRRQRADQANTNKRFQRARGNQLREVFRDRERRAVAVLREVESRAGVAPGGLREQLIDEGKLVGTRDRVIGYRVDDHPEAGSITNPVAVPQSIGHTPVEILAAFGIDDVAIQELYEGLVEDRLNAGELRRAQKRQAAQARRDEALAS